MERVLLDTGPLVAYLNRRDAHHAWAVGQWGSIRPPLLTCEAVLAEACFLVRALHGGSEAVLELVRRRVVQVGFGLSAEADAVAQLLKRYADVPMSLADACLVRMAEQHAGSSVFTLDTDFRIYRMSNRRVIPLITTGHT